MHHSKSSIDVAYVYGCNSMEIRFLKQVLEAGLE